MPKKNPPLLLKLSNLVKTSIFLAKLKKPIIPKLIIFLKKTSKLNKFKPLKQYNYYNYVKEYEFSPSSTPLIEFRSKSRNGRISFNKLYSNVFFLSRCLGRECDHRKKEMYCLEMRMEQYPCFEIESAVGRELVAVDSSSDSWSEDDDQTVDERAERFIQRFYEDMRRQRRDGSNLQLLEM
ncbi:hypothetical protein ACS0TY_008361 [Phlomoides rotata]